MRKWGKRSGHLSNHNEDGNQASMFGSYTNHPCRKELEDGHVNANTASSQSLENIFQLHIKPVGT